MKNDKLPNIEHPEQDNAKLKQKNVSLCALLDTRTENRDKTYTVRIRIIFDRKAKYYTTKIQLSKDQYKSLTGLNPRGTLRKSKVVVIELLKKANDIIEGMPVFSFDSFERKFFGKAGQLSDVQKAFKQHIQEL
ncbi:MAG: hypothetical protein PHV35_02095, partial [Mariniphaga sp.]|nr:hypothetical protein [Mariniphaga sp.]